MRVLCNAPSESRAHPAHEGVFTILDVDFYEKAHFVKPTWRPCIVAECNGCAPFALCFYPHFRGATLLGGSVHRMRSVFSS
jgi:hypothetical protein